MSDEDRFKHHEFLQAVANEDVRFVLEKDRSYGASWKMSGGRSAWFMLRRKIDRMLEMMKRPGARVSLEAFQKVGDDKVVMTVREFQEIQRELCSEDIFRKIEDAPSGVDGTVLAEVRDLRRYLMLVEAEMMARGVVPNPGPTEGLSADLDGVQNSSMAPWAVNTRWRFKHDMQPGGKREHVFNQWWNAVAEGVWVLEPCVETPETPPPEVEGLFFALTNTERPRWIVDVQKIPDDTRDWFPVLRFEVTTHEAMQLPAWQRALYRYEPEKGEYRLINDAWSRGA